MHIRKCNIREMFFVCYNNTSDFNQKILCKFDTPNELFVEVSIARERKCKMNIYINMKSQLFHFEFVAFKINYK